MARFLDGPLAGKSLSLRRCPVWLRAVRDWETGKVDALDQLDDSPAPGERIFVYRAVPGTWTVAFIRPGGRFEFAEYEHVALDDAVVEVLRETGAWREWVMAQPVVETS